MGYKLQLTRKDGTVITVEQENESLDLSTVIDLFEDFLRGVGFSFDGYIDVVEPEIQSDRDQDVDEALRLSSPESAMEAAKRFDEFNKEQARVRSIDPGILPGNTFNFEPDNCNLEGSD